MKHLKKCIMRLLSIMLAAVMSLFAGISASAKPAYQWGMDCSSSNPEDHYGYKSSGDNKFSVDSKVHTDNSWYSIRFDIADYKFAFIEKTYNVEPNTTYKFSAMVKYSRFQAAPNAPKNATGAYLSRASYYDHEKNNRITPGPDSEYTTSSEWKLLEYEFTTGNETTYGLRIGSSFCNGTVWFSDIKLEKPEKTNSWNVLAVFFKNVDATVTLNGKTVHHKNSLTEAKINEVNTYCLNKLPTLLRDLSNNKMTVNSIDRYYTDEILTEKDLTPQKYQDKAETIPNGYCITSESPTIVKVLDKYLAQKHYNQIIVFYPIEGIDGGWFGLAGEYKGVGFAQIDTGWDEQFKNDDRFQGQVAVHEMCHVLERRSKAINGDKTPVFHDILNEYTKQYPSSPDVSAYERIHQYMTCTLPDGRGLDPSVFYVSNGKYTLVSDDMTTGTGIEPGSSSVAPPAPKNLVVKAVEDDKVKVTWNAVPKASGYQVGLFKDAAFNETWKTFGYNSDSTTTYLLPITKGVPYYYGVRTVASVNGNTVYSDWTTLTYTHEGVKVVRGDVDNNGKFNFDDVVLALDLYLSDAGIDQRTQDAAGISGRTYLLLDDVVYLLDLYLSI